MERVNRRHRRQCRKHHARRSELHEAAAAGKLVKVQSLVLAGAIVNDTSKHYNKETALFGACASRSIDTVKYLLRCGGDPTIVAASGHTAFAEACKAGFLPCCKLLAEWTHKDEEAGIDLWRANRAGWTAFHWAVQAGNKKLVSWLLKPEQRRRRIAPEGMREEEAQEWAAQTAREAAEKTKAVEARKKSRKEQEARHQYVDTDSDDE